MEGEEQSIMQVKLIKLFVIAFQLLTFFLAAFYLQTKLIIASFRFWIGAGLRVGLEWHLLIYIYIPIL